MNQDREMVLKMGFILGWSWGHGSDWRAKWAGTPVGHGSVRRSATTSGVIRRQNGPGLLLAVARSGDRPQHFEEVLRGRIRTPAGLPGR
jgi:hypothetical protein